METYHGTSTILQRLFETVAGHLSGAHDARNVRIGKGPFPNAQQGNGQSRRVAIHRPVTGRPVKDENDAKGYAHGENDYVILTDDDLCNVALDTVNTIDIQKFAPAESIEWVYLEKPYYLTPDDAVGYEAFAVTDKA